MTSLVLPERAGNFLALVDILCVCVWLCDGGESDGKTDNRQVIYTITI